MPHTISLHEVFVSPLLFREKNYTGHFAHKDSCPSIIHLFYSASNTPVDKSGSPLPSYRGRETNSYGTEADTVFLGRSLYEYTLLKVADYLLIDSTYRKQHNLQNVHFSATEEIHILKYPYSKKLTFFQKAVQFLLARMRQNLLLL